jgi:hypothetical protein
MEQPGYKGVRAIARAVATRTWARLDAEPPAVVVGIAAVGDDDGGRVRLCILEWGERAREGGGMWASGIWLGCTGPGLALYRVEGAGYDAALFEVSMATYSARPAGMYEAVVGLVGDTSGGPARVRVRRCGGVDGVDEVDQLVVAAGEFQPAWRNVTLYPSLWFRQAAYTSSQRGVHDGVKPTDGEPAFELLSGPSPRVLYTSSTSPWWACRAGRGRSATCRTWCYPTSWSSQGSATFAPGRGAGRSQRSYACGGPGRHRGAGRLLSRSRIFVMACGNTECD